MLDQRSSRLQASSLFLLSLFLTSDLLTGKYQIFERLGVPRPPVFCRKSAEPDSPAPTRTEHEAILTANGLLDLNLKVVSINSAAAKEPKAGADFPKLVFAVLTLGAAMALIGFLATSFCHLFLNPALRWIEMPDLDRPAAPGNAETPHHRIQSASQLTHRIVWVILPNIVRTLVQFLRVSLTWTNQHPVFWSREWSRVAIVHHSDMPDSLRNMISRRWDTVVLSWNFLWIMFSFGVFDCVVARWCDREHRCPNEEPVLWIATGFYMLTMLVFSARFSIAWHEIVSITNEFLSQARNPESNLTVRVVVER